jgi:glycosyltransferase involved in cell wall biosynthesis
VYVRNLENMGAVNSRMSGLKIAHGEFVAFHDDDDIAHPNRLSAPLRFLMANHSFAACYCDFDFIRDGIRRHYNNDEPFSKEAYLNGRILIGSAIMLMRKDALIECPFLPEYNHAIDYDWVFRALRQGLTIDHCPANVLDYYSDADAKRLSGNNPESRRQHKKIREREYFLDSLG